ncbi:MAG TPA: S41 family peptidase [Allosphingosinicella sp.]|nr:S41 family peptidase [Allosphingosinicella sp.]
MRMGSIIGFSVAATVATLVPVAAQAAQAPAASASPAAPAPAPPIDAATRKNVIELAIAKMTAHYIFPEKVPVIARALRGKLSSGAYDRLDDPKAFAEAVNADIQAVAHDKHMRIFWLARGLPPRNAAGQPDPAELQRMQRIDADRNFEMPKVEVLDGNIGYLKMNGFDPAEQAAPVFAAAMAFLRRTDAIIFDMRENHGGDPHMVSFAVSYLFPVDTLIITFHDRGGTDQQMWSLPDVPGGRWSTDKPVYVLTSDKTASGGEEFAYDIQQLKRGTIVGGTTWGGANPGGVEPLDAHFAIFVPQGAPINPVSKANWEGVGVKPDVPVDPAAALDVAWRMAMAKLIAGAEGDRRTHLESVLAAKATAAAPMK